MNVKGMIKRLANAAGVEVTRKDNAHSSLEFHLASIFSKYSIDCVLDVGANSGQYGESLRKFGYDGWIISFEPVESVFNQLIDFAKGDEKWICKNVALGDKAETRLMNVYGNTLFSSFLDASEYSKKTWKSLDNVNFEEVSVVRLDDIFLPDIHNRTSSNNYYLKLDTQGYDINVFRGGLNSLDKVCAMQSELSLIHVYEKMSSPYETLNEFHSRGFSISGMYPINREDSLAVIEYDCVLVKRYDHA